jgi:CrcB protein
MASSPDHRDHAAPRAHRLRGTGVIPVAMGGLLGSAARAGVSELLPVDATGFPTATLLVNLVGSLLLGVYLVRRERAVTAAWSLRFWAFGVFGSFTTFSAFSLEVVLLIEKGRGSTAAAYVLASVIGGSAAALFGQRMATRAR